MSRNLFDKVVTTLSVFTVMLVLSANLQAQVKPIKIKGTGDAPAGLSLEGDASLYSMTGTANHLGKYTGIGVAQVTGPATFTGAYLFVAANGDLLLCEHPGTYEVFPEDGRLYAVFDAIFTPVAGTGRFEGVTGGFRMIATTGLFDSDGIGTTPFELKWRGKGELGF